MNSTDIFDSLSDQEAEAVLSGVHAVCRPVYRAAAGMLATRARLRPVFIERKPRVERHQWMKQALAKPTNADIAEQLLQTWLLEGHRPMIIDFLESLSIPHDGEGLLETLPEEPSDEALKAAVNALLEKYDPLVVRIYLFIFAEIDPERWTRLPGILAEHPAFQSATPTAVTQS